MSVLSPGQRSTLEKIIIDARDIAEVGARHALQSLAVNHPEPFAHMTPEQRGLRNRLRNKARLLGDELPSSGHQQIEHLVYELAYEYWHKMLFARFLETNGLLMHPDGVAVTMEDCEELAREEGFANKWSLAASYASLMLPAIFRPDDPLMQINFAADDRIKLESLLDKLETSIFKADDSLGWVYQFWQSKAKEIINASGDKIDGTKLPAVTQLFTEPYMVHFLLDNTLGGWWVSRHPNIVPPVKLAYLRLLDDGTPAAGRFEEWPNTTAEVTLLDPCMGSGHFVVAAFTMLANLRMYEEGLSAADATDKVITQNLHGLELDTRCTQIAAFNLALAAWKFCGEYRILPEMNLACSGMAPQGKKDDWVKLVAKEIDPNQKQRLENGIKVLYDLFQQAPELGSLIDPTLIQADLYTASFEELKPVLIKALNQEANKEVVDRGVVALGIAHAGKILAKKYTLLITNVPYLARNKQDEMLAEYCVNYYSEAKGDLATVFLERMLKANIKGGTSCSVIPQNWLFLTTFKKYREKLLKTKSWSFVARLGPKGFQTPMWDFNVMLISINNKQAKSESSFIGFDVSEAANASAKDIALHTAEINWQNQLQQLKNPDARVILSESNSNELLNKYADCYAGILNGDSPRFQKFFWEIFERSDLWTFQQTTVDMNKPFGGLSLVIYYDFEKGHLREEAWIRREKLHDSDQRGNKAWGKWGISVSSMNSLPISLFIGSTFDSNVAVIYPKNQDLVLPIWAYCQSKIYNQEVRKIDQALKVTNATLVKVPFDLKYWQKVAEEQYPNGLPKPYSDDPSQWLFHGNPLKTESPLQVGLARLLGFVWPAENDTEMELAEEAKMQIQKVKAFSHLADEDGILCVPSVNGESAAAEKLRIFMKAIYSEEWKNQTVEQLLAKEGSKKSNLEEWLREEFFEQHCKLFQNRPFIWHIWDGRRDGFGAIVNYHRLTKENLSKLIYTYLGDWIRLCEGKVKDGISGAEGLLSAAQKLKEKLELILEGEKPYDIFVRWKPLSRQPIGWEPDLNDGIRLNIRPFIQADVLRKKPNIKWGIDRGNNPSGSYWGEKRDNDRHLSLIEKRAARENQ